MSTKKHTPEPLTWQNERGFLKDDSQVHQLVTSTSNARRLADGKRMVTCYNACAGIQDPELALRKAREALERFAMPEHLISPEHQDEEMFAEISVANVKAAREALSLLSPKGEG